MTQYSPLKKILMALHDVEPDIIGFFVAENSSKDNIFHPKTINNAFDPSKGMSKNLIAFFEKYIPQPHINYSYDSLIDKLKLFMESHNRDNSQIREKFSNALKHGAQKEHTHIIEESDYIGNMQDPELAFHDEEMQQMFFKKLRNAIRDEFRKQKLLSNVFDHKPGVLNYQLESVKIGSSDSFELTYIEAALVCAPLSQVSCALSGSMVPPPPSASSFAARAMRPGVYDGASFGLCDFSLENNKGINRLNIDLRWTTYFRSLEQCDAKYMTAIYAFGKQAEQASISKLVATGARVFENRGGSTLPILGVTTAVIFRRGDKKGPYWTFVQLKEGGASRIIESHLTPSFVSQPATRMMATLNDEAADIDFHIRRELIEEIFNFPENISPDYHQYKKTVNSHPAIQALDMLMDKGKAELFCHGLVFDIHRSKYELINVLRIDCPTWFDQISEHIRANHEAIANGVVLVPLTEEGVYQALTGTLTYTRPIRRMCSPGQAALAAAIQHLKKRDDENVQNIEFISDIT